MRPTSIFLLTAAVLLLSCRRPPEDIHTYSVIGSCPLPGYSRYLALHDTYAYVANDQGGLQIVDIADPTHPVVTGSYQTQANVQGVAVRDTFAYLALAAGPPNNVGLVIVNIRDPENPAFVSQDNWFYAYNIDAPTGDTQYVYIAGRYWFIVEDVSWPQYPNYARRFATAGNVHAAQVVDSLAYLVCEQIGLLIYNLNRPDSIAQVGEIDTPANARDVAVQNGYAYIADGDGGLVIIDVRDPAHPITAGSYDTPGYAQGIAVASGRAYIADGSDGIQVIDISVPAHPLYYGSLSTPYAYHVQEHDSRIYLADRDQGLLIISEDAP